MAYKRKTQDVYEIHEYVPGYGWEYSCTEDTWVEALAQKKCYIENGVVAKIVKKREKIVLHNA